MRAGLAGTLILTLAAISGCAVVRPSVTGRTGVTARQPVAGSTVWPAPGGNLATCAPGTPGGDKPTPRTPFADTLRVRNKTLRTVVATLCSFSVPVPEINTGASQDPLQ